MSNSKTTSSNPDNANKSMKKGEKIFFALADFYGGGGQALIGVLYFVFLTNIVGLEPILAGAVTIIAEIWDAISDPLMGVIGDNTRTKFGRRRPYIFASGCLLAVAFALIFLPLGTLDQTWKFIYCTATYLLYNTVSTMFNVSYSSMSAEISKVSEERDAANVLRLVVSTVGTALCTLLPTFVIDAYDNHTIDIWGFYLVVGIGFGLLYAVPVILCAIFTRERVDVPDQMVKFNIKEFVEPLGNKSFRQLVLMYLGQALCMDVFSAGIVMFAKYVTEPKGSSTIFLALFIAIQLIAFPIVNKLIKTIDVNRIYGFGLPLSITALVVFAIFGSNLYVAYVCVFFIALGFAGAQLTSWIMFPHTVDAGELMTGKRQSGGSSAIMTFARKSSSALVIFLFSTVLQFTGYDDELEIQPIMAQNGIKYVMAFTCIAFMVLGFIIARRYILSKSVNAKVEKYLKISRDGRLEELSDEERAEYDALITSLKYRGHNGIQKRIF